MLSPQMCAFWMPRASSIPDVFHGQILE